MAERDETLQIIDRIYDVAVDPARYEAMLDVWERRLSVLRRQADESAVIPIRDDAGITPHIERADIFLQRLLDAQTDATRSPLDASSKATFLVNRRMVIDSANEAAVAALRVRGGDPLDRLPLHKEDIGSLRAAIRQQLSADPAPPALLRFTSVRSRHAVLLHVAPWCAGPLPLVVVRTTELGWSPRLSDALRRAFGLTGAEAEVVRALAEGQSLREISAARRRSVTTVRTQIGAILGKTETHSQTELVRLTLGLMDVVGTEPGSGDAPAGPGDLEPIPFRSLVTRDGRRSDWIEFGDPAGRPCLFLSLDYGLIRWPAAAEAAAARRRIRVVAPVRAGYGRSTPLRADVASYRSAIASDMAELLDHLAIPRAAILAFGADLRFALALAVREPRRVSGIFGCSAALPGLDARQYERMGKWHRFILANARYAPRILPFLVRSGFALARGIGKESFFRAVNAGSPADMRTFSDPAIRDAILMGSDICLGPQHSAHDAFARECIDSETDWSDLVHACPVPVRLLQGGEDPQTPAETVRERMPAFPTLDVEIVENAGQLVFFQEWPRVLDELEQMLRR